MKNQPNANAIQAKRGRKPKTFQRATTIRQLIDASPVAARYLRAVLDKTEQPNWAIIDVCKYVINQDLGTPRQRMEHTGADGTPLLPYTELILLAERVEQERLIIIDKGLKEDKETANLSLKDGGKVE